MVAMKSQSILTDAEKAVVEQSVIEIGEEGDISGFNKEVGIFSRRILIIFHS